MLDSPAYIWQRTDQVLFNTPVPCRPFNETLKAMCSSARSNGGNWTVHINEATTAIATIRAYFPVVQDDRTNAPLAALFVDDDANDVFGRLDLVPLFTPVVPALQAIHNVYHDDRAHLAAVAAYAPDVPFALGFAESSEKQWPSSQTAQRFWQQLLIHIADAVRGEMQPDGSVIEHITPDNFQALWLQLREEWCGDVPERTGQRWYPPLSTLPVWAAALLACCSGPAFTLDVTNATLSRTLPPWPLRRSDELHRLDLKDAAHWPVSVCVLPGKQSRDGSDALLHLSSVGGVSKNRALWAAVLDGKREQVPLRVGRQRFYARRVEGRSQYISEWNDEPLHTSGLCHLALTHRSAFEPELGEGFLHLAGNDLSGAPDYELFAQQLSRCLSLPFDLSWGKQLWQYAVEPLDAEIPLITPLPSSGCQGYWVLPDEARWTRLIVALQKRISPAEFGETDLVITEVGTTTMLADIVEQAGEGDSEAFDDVE